jgi:XRE family transcriptional regulator, regulator of sulfur utilization
MRWCTKGQTNVRDNVRAMTTVTTEALAVGPRIRALREAMDLSLRDLAEQSGVSAPMLSQVERGETSPTLAVAGKIAAGLELSLSQLLRLDEGDGVNVVRADKRLLGGRADGHRYEVLTPPVPGQRAEVSLHTLAPGSATGGPGDPPIHEPGSRETAVVLDGGLRLVCDGVAHDLAEGDAVTFDADLPHHFENPGRRDARFMSVVAAGLRRS